jgi:nitrate/nitrite-specific signal transduction histidine kinase
MKSATKKLYFAYGSNMNQARLVARVGAVKKAGTLRLSGYRLLFDTGTKSTSIYANIQKTGNPKDFVEGVVYELSATQIKILDRYEMLYNRVLENVGKMTLNVYICIDESSKTLSNYKKPTPDYLNLILQGAKENNLTETYEKIYRMIPSPSIVAKQ